VRTTRTTAAVALALFIATAGCGSKPPPDPSSAERLNDEGLRALDRGETDAADDLFRRALGEAELVDDLRSQAEAWNNRGLVAFGHGDCEGAWRDHAAALRLHELRGVRDAGEVRTRENLGTALLACGRRDEARVQLTLALTLAGSLKDAGEAMRARLGLASLALAEGRADDAVAQARVVTDARKEVRDEGTLAAALALEGAALEAKGDLAGARAKLEDAVAVDRKREVPGSVAADLKALANVAERAGEAARASAYLLRAARIDRRMGALEDAARELARARDLAAKGSADEAEAIAAELAIVKEAADKAARAKESVASPGAR
jgi:tetratricopeptide (TPR) repeat protein